MSFSVNTKSLVGLPLALDRRGSDLDLARQYLAADTIIQTFNIADIRHVHEHVIAAVAGYLDALNSTFAEADAVRVRAVIATYRAADARAARRADAALSGLVPGLPQTPPLTPIEQSYGPAIFDDRRTPAAALIPPSSHYADLPYQPGILDVLSPSTIGRDVIWRATSFLTHVGVMDRPIDPLETFVQPMVGDWAGLLRCAEVFVHIADLLARCGDCVTDAALLVPKVWAGNVEGMCVLNLNGFATSLAQGILPLTDLAAMYPRVATGVQDNAVVMETVISDLIDLGSDLVLAEIGSSLLDIWAVSTQIRNFLRTVGTAIHLVNNVQDIISVWKNGVGSATHSFGVLQQPGPMPSMTAAPIIPVPAGR